MCNEVHTIEKYGVTRVKKTYQGNSIEYLTREKSRVGSKQDMGANCRN